MLVRLNMVVRISEDLSYVFRFNQSKLAAPIEVPPRVLRSPPLLPSVRHCFVVVNSLVITMMEIFVRLILYIPRHNPVMKSWLVNRSGRYHTTYMSPQSQNEFIMSLGEEIRRMISDKVK